VFEFLLFTSFLPSAVSVYTYDSLIVYVTAKL